MFRSKPKIPQLSVEEIERLKQTIIQQPVAQQIIQPLTQPIKEGSKYFICRKDLIKERKRIQTASGQIIETGEEVIEEEINEIYQLTREDLVTLIKFIPESKTISKIFLQMLLQEV